MADMGPYDLTPPERQWATNLKKVLTEADPEFAASITDMEYVQHAIIAKDSVSTGMKRIRRLKEFKDSHGIAPDATVEDAMNIVRKFLAKAPGCLVSIGREKTGTTRRFVIGMEYQAMVPANFTEEDDWKNCMAAFYYLFEASQSDVRAVRDGVAWICECRGMGWRNFSLQMEKEAAKLYQDAYPMRITDITMLNATRIMKAMYALCKPFLSKRVKEVFRMNGTLVGVQLKFNKELLPTTMGGVQGELDMLDRLEKALTRRFESKETFKL